jgi:tetratricopeptide (TPR) repeat protein
MSARNEAADIHNLGVSFHRNCRYVEAVTCFERSAAMFGAIGRAVSEANSRHALADELHLIGDHSEAAIQYSRAYDLWIGEGHTRDAAVAMLNAGAELCELSQYAGAVECLEVAANLSHSIGDQDLRSRCLINLGICRQSNGHQ